MPRYPCREVHAIRTLRDAPSPAVTTAAHSVFGVVDVLREIYAKLGPDPPPDLKSTRVDSNLPDATAETLLYNYDEGHSGRFSVPADAATGASLSFDYVLSKPDADEYIRSNLTFAAPGTTPLASPAHPQIFFAPGLNSMHQPFGDQTSTPRRLAHVVRMLPMFPMAQIHLGSQYDQGDAIIDASKAPFFRFLVSVFGGMIPSAARPRVEGTNLKWWAGHLDGLQAGMSELNLVDTPIKQRFTVLLERTRATDENPAVPVSFVVHSRASIELGAALHKHIEKSRDDGESQEAIEQRLRDNVTILTFGNATRRFPDGPAYVHVASLQDPITWSRGVREDRPDGAGKDAVFLNFDSPYAERAEDAHNVNALITQYLAIVVRKNGVMTIHSLWEKGQEKDGISLPQNMDALLAAMVVLTGGREWLWDEEEALEGVPADRFPSSSEALSIVSKEFGEEYAEYISSTAEKFS